jgi:Amt family ammonium transporter
LLVGLTALTLLVTAQVVWADAPPATTGPTSPPGQSAETPKIDSGDTAWMLTSTGLVLLMLPGLALFYGG